MMRASKANLSKNGLERLRHGTLILNVKEEGLEAQADRS